MPGLATLFAKTGAFLQEDAQLASVFVHYGLFGDNGRHSARFMQFVDRLARGELPDAAMFRETFGVSMKRMETTLATYARNFASYKSTDVRGDIPPMPAPVFRGATQSEVARIKSEVSVSLANPAKALDELRIAYWRGERELAMLASLATLEQQIGSEARARKILKALLALPAQPPQAFIVAARLQLMDTFAIKSPGAKLDANETEELLNVLGRAVTGGLTTEDLCTTLAEVVAHSSVAPDAGLAAFLREAAKRYPKNQAIAKALAPTGK